MSADDQLDHLLLEPLIVLRKTIKDPAMLPTINYVIRSLDSLYFLNLEDCDGELLSLLFHLLGSPRNLVADALVCDIVVSDFELQSC